MDSEKSHSPEAREQPGRYNELTVDLIRHGESMYKNISPDLTEKGMGQIKSTAEKLADAIDPDEKIIFWTSPAVRAQDSASIVKTVLQEKGLQISKEKTVASLRPLKIENLQFVLDLYKEVAAAGKPDTAFMEHPEFAADENPNMETRPQVEKRLDRIINYLRYLVEHVDFQDKKFRMIMLSHFEIAEPIAQEVFGSQEAFLQGDNLEIKMVYDKETKNTEIKFSFRGQDKGPFGWDKQTRQLIEMKQ